VEESIQNESNAVADNMTTQGDVRRSFRQVLVGVVTSDKMDKTVVVEVSRKVRHPVYRKFVPKRARFKAHDEKNEYLVGDKVKILSCRPLSKEKCWVVQSLIERPR